MIATIILAINLIIKNNSIVNQIIYFVSVLELMLIAMATYLVQTYEYKPYKALLDSFYALKRNFLFSVILVVLSKIALVISVAIIKSFNMNVIWLTISYSVILWLSLPVLTMLQASLCKRVFN